MLLVPSDRQDVDMLLSVQMIVLRDHANENGYVVVREYVDMLLSVQMIVLRDHANENGYVVVREYVDEV